MIGLRRKPRIGVTPATLATAMMTVLILVAVLLAACANDSDRGDLITSTTLPASTHTTSESRVIEDATYELRVDRRGGSEDSEEAFGFLPEARYQPTEGGPVYRVVISEQGSRVSVEGEWGDTHLAVEGERTSETDGRIWYDLIDEFAGGRVVVWWSGASLQGEFTLYGSGRPIISSERGPMVRDPAP